MRRLPVLLALTIVACGDEGLDPEGFHWEVEASTVEDLCNPPPLQEWQESYVYSLYFDGGATDLKIDDQTFATGTISGCRLTYESFLVGERRGPDDQFWVQWILEGEATLRQGGSSCDLDTDVDWFGTEVFTILQASEELGYPKDCTYTTTVQGTYLGHGENL